VHHVSRVTLPLHHVRGGFAQIWALHYVGLVFFRSAFCVFGGFPGEVWCRLVPSVPRVADLGGCGGFWGVFCVLGVSVALFMVYGLLWRSVGLWWGVAQIWGVHYVGACFCSLGFCVFGVFLVKSCTNLGLVFLCCFGLFPWVLCVWGFPGEVWVHEKTPVCGRGFVWGGVGCGFQF